jgi:hypothetical protein
MTKDFSAPFVRQRNSVAVVGLIVACVSSIAGCDDTHSCTDNLVFFGVLVTAPDDTPIDSVTAISARGTIECEPASDRDADGGDDRTPTARTYQCEESVGTEYEIRVRSRSRSWSKHVRLAADECHLDQGQVVSFTLEPNTAD